MDFMGIRPEILPSLSAVRPENEKRAVLTGTLMFRDTYVIIDLKEDASGRFVTAADADIQSNLPEESRRREKAAEEVSGQGYGTNTWKRET